ncbi:hypothetical protein C8A05DRAFT_36827 [Staphylotrichum tortipilum]|uniref:Uncharacterized protein n=1 Tax=Staphylotrichum tortipilum TaxID=2831512 RepID=A0AAN6RQC8_9PEZI|nr:hypothetical protein C8A05DRAFT_36827 [Staphylotrichum longicolle]
MDCPYPLPALVSRPAAHAKDALPRATGAREPGLVWCEYCRKLHSAAPLGPAGAAQRPCDERRHSVFLQATGGKITLPLIRAVVQRDRQGRDPSELFGDINRRAHMAVRGTPYSALADYEARVVDGSVLLRKQVFVARDAPYSGPGGRPDAGELIALGRALRQLQDTGDAADRLWWDLCAIPVLPCMASLLDKPRQASDRGGHGAGAGAPKVPEVCGHPRLDVAPGAPPPSNWEYNPHLNNIPHPRCCTGWAPILGHVQGCTEDFLDYSMTACPAPDEVGGRVLVFTWWRDLGSGSSTSGARWRAGSGADRGMEELPPMWSRQRYGGAPYDAVRAFEQQSHGTWYVTRPTRTQAEMLYSPWNQVPDVTRKEYLKTCKSE